MRFYISRTSGEGEKPHQAAIQDEKGKWFVDALTLDDLLDLINTEGEVILIPPMKSFWNDKRRDWRVEIYDTYRE